MLQSKDSIQNICKHLGITSLKPEQEEILTYLSQNHSVLAMLPTGYGKTLCFLWPALVWKRKIIVVSPLIALMQEQEQKFLRLGLSVLAVHSHKSAPEKKEAYKRILHGDWDIILTSPEQILLWQKRYWWQTLLSQTQLWAFDEAHCLFLWQYFRPAYAHIANLLPILKQYKKSVLFLSATLTPEQIQALNRILPLKKVSQSIGRKNIFLRVLPLQTYKDRYFNLFRAIQNSPTTISPIIIYCSTRREASGLASYLFSSGWNARAYHAGLSFYQRELLVKAFHKGKISILCATSAFGMGIDYPSISKIIHWGAPMCMEDYWQEVGRAGRNLQPAQSLVFWNRSDLLRWRYFIQGYKKNISLKKKLALQQSIQYFQTKKCRRIWLAEYFGLQEDKCNACDNCCPQIFSYLSTPSQIPWWFEEKFLDKNIVKKF